MRFIIEKNRLALTLGDLLDLEGANNITTIYKLMVKCVADDDGNFVEREEAERQLRSIPLDELPGVMEQYAAAFNQFKAGVLPPNGGGK